MQEGPAIAVYGRVDLWPKLSNPEVSRESVRNGSEIAIPGDSYLKSWLGYTNIIECT